MVGIRRIYAKLFGWMPYKLKGFLYKMWCTFSSAGRVSNRGERWVAGSWDEIISTKDLYSTQHAHRYFWAEQMLRREEDILDIGCGTGYGSWYLASKGHSVVGYDLSERAIRWARKHFKHPNVSFTHSLWDLDNSDVICSFEVIEHVGETGSNRRSNWMEFLCSRLKRGGTLIISTPNCADDAVSAYLSRRGYQTEDNPFHDEMTKEELRSLLSRYFREIKLYGQGLVGVYDFDEYGRNMSRIDVELEDFEMRDYELKSCPVIVAVCKNLRDKKRVGTKELNADG